MSVEEIAKGLSEAQRRWLVDGAFMVALGAGQEWFTYPPSNTAGVLHRLGLWQWRGNLTPLGIIIRDHLRGQS